MEEKITTDKPIKNIKELGIDIGSVKNLDVEGADSSALKEALEKRINENIPVTKKKTKRSTKFNFTQSSSVPLPSGGRFYKTDDEDIRAGFIKMFPLTVREEEILSTPRYIIDGTATIMAVNNCIDSDIDVSDLLMYDYTYLLFYLRKISFGDEYVFKNTCDNCGHEFKKVLKISEIKFDTLPKDFKDPYRIELPVSKYTIILSMPRVKHITEFDRIRTKLTVKERETYSGISDMFMVRTSGVLSDTGDIVPKEDWTEFYQSLPGLDRRELAKHSVIESGINKVMDNVTCPNCEAVVGGAIPVTDDFFRFGK